VNSGATDLANVNNSANIKSNLNISNSRGRRPRSNLPNRERHDDRIKHRNFDQAKSRRAQIAQAYMPKQSNALRSRTAGRDCRETSSRLNANSKTSRGNSELKNYHERQPVAPRLLQSRKAQTPSKSSDSSNSASGSPREASGPKNFERKTHRTHSKSRGAASSQLSVSGLKIFTSSARNEVQGQVTDIGTQGLSKEYCPDSICPNVQSRLQHTVTAMTAQKH